MKVILCKFCRRYAIVVAANQTKPVYCRLCHHSMPYLQHDTMRMSD